MKKNLKEILWEVSVDSPKIRKTWPLYSLYVYDTPSQNAYYWQFITMFYSPSVCAFLLLANVSFLESTAAADTDNTS